MNLTIQPDGANRSRTLKDVTLVELEAKGPDGLPRAYIWYAGGRHLLSTSNRGDRIATEYRQQCEQQKVAPVVQRAARM